MTDWSIRLWSWVGAHRLLAGWAAAVLCLTAFSGGIALGAAREQPAPFQQRARPALARPDSGLVTALVIGRRGASLITRTREGDLLIVRTAERTVYRRRNADADASVVRRGARVLVLGRPAEPGVLSARMIVVRGQRRSPVRPPEAIDLPR